MFNKYMKIRYKQNNIDRKWLVSSLSYKYKSKLSKLNIISSYRTYFISKIIYFITMKIYYDFLYTFIYNYFIFINFFYFIILNEY